MKLKISNDLSLPAEAVTQTFAILAKRGVGKTYTASVMAEEMLKNNLPLVVLDPIGVWWGLRSSADGKSAGLPIIIAGGDHADVPIEPSSGEVVANLVVNEKLSVVIDLSLFRKGEQTRFVTDFAETLYHKNRSALHIIADEADAFAPQKAFRGQERMLGAMEDLVRRGRARGIGVTLITQRPAVLNKDVLTQIEVLIPMRLISPQDRNAINEWVKVHGDPGQSEELMQSLPSLPIGTAWVWSPGWLDIFKRVKIRKRETLDSSSTPKAGKLKVEPRAMADVDLERIRIDLAATIEKVKADDPKILRRKIVELERDLSKQKPSVKEVVKEVEVLVIPDSQVQALTAAVLNMQGIAEEILKVIKAAGLRQPQPNTNEPTTVRPAPKQQQVQISDDSELSNYAQGLLKTIAVRFPMKLTRAQISTMSGRKPRSSAFSNAMAEIVRTGVVNRIGNQYELTEKGQKMADTTDQTPQTSEEILSMWRAALPIYQRDLFDALVESYPQTVAREELSERTGRSITSSAFHGAISSLIKNELIETNDGELRASDNLFLNLSA